MAIALVVSTIKAASASTSSVTSDAVDTTGSSLLVVAVSSYAVVAVATVTDSKSNTWTQLTTRTDPGANLSRQTLYYAQNPTVGTGHTFTASTSPTASFPAIGVYAFSGTATTAVFDVENGNGADAVTSIQPGSVTPTQNNEVVVAALCFESSDTISIGSGFTLSDQVPWVVNVNFGLAIAYKIQTTAGAENPTWSWTTSDDIATAIATFKVRGGILFVTSAGADVTAAASTWSLVPGGSSMTAGGAVIVGVGCASTSVTVSTITDNTTNLYRKAIAHGTPRSTAGAELWYCQGFSTASTRISLTLSGASSGRLGYCEFTGFSTAGALGPTASSGVTVKSSGAASHSAADIGTPASSGVAVSFACVGASTLGAFTTGASYTAWLSTGAGGAARSFGQYWIQATASTASGPFGTSSGVTHSAAIAYFFDTVVVTPGGGNWFGFCLMGVQ